MAESGGQYREYLPLSAIRVRKEIRPE